MSTFKKVISLVLCFAMLVGTVSVVGNLVTPEVSAAEGTSVIDAIADLNKAYDDYIYLGVDFYEIETSTGGLSGDEIDRTLTDHKVQPGQLLVGRMYIKTDMYLGAMTTYQMYDNSFFDVRQLTAAAPTGTNGYSSGATTVQNADHPATKSHNLSYALTSGPVSGFNWANETNSAFTAEFKAKWDSSWHKANYEGSIPYAMSNFTTDEWVYEWRFKVKDGLEEGTEGRTYSDYHLWKCGDPDLLADHSGYNDKTEGRNTARQSNVNFLHRDSNATEEQDQAVKLTSLKNMYGGYNDLGAFIMDDLDHTFIIASEESGGTDTPAPEVAGESVIDAIADLNKAYDDYIYLGVDFYEIETTTGDLSGAETSRILTDHKVEAGELLVGRMYIKTDMYLGAMTTYQMYDNSFFDVRQLTTAAPTGTNGYSSGATTDQNADHPATKSHNLSYALTSGPVSGFNWANETNSAFTAEFKAQWDSSWHKANYEGSIPYAMSNFTTDEWVYEWRFKVKDDVETGDSGRTYSDYHLWKCGDPDLLADHSGYNDKTEGRNTARQSNVNFLHRDSNATEEQDQAVKLTSLKNMYGGYNDLGAFIMDDLDHTFTVVEASSNVKSFTITFLNSDGSTAEEKTYAENADVTIPAEVADQIGWANVATGKIEDLTGYKAVRNATFKRVLSTDKFTVTVNLGGGTFAEEDAAKLPADAVVERGSLKLLVPFGTEYDLSKLPVPQKVGKTAAYNPATITVDSIKGATVSIEWTDIEYTVSFYVNKGDAEPYMTKTAKYGGSVNCDAPAAPTSDAKFAGWADVATDVVAVAGRPTIGSYNYTEDKAYYATWTAYDSSISFMVKDFLTGEWKTAAVKYNDSGKKLSATDFKAICADIEATQNIVIPKQAGTPVLFIKDNYTEFYSASSGITFDGNAVYYIPAQLQFNVTWKAPIIDVATGDITGYNEKTVAANTIYTSSTKELTTDCKAAIDVTPPAGYSFKGWKNEATGEAVEYNANIGVVLGYNDARDITFVADFAETEYALEFNMQNGDYITRYTADKAFKKGEAIDLDVLTFTNNENGNAATLPVVGVENTELETPVFNRNGYKLAGWKLGTGANAIDVTFPIDELTSEMIQKYTMGGKLIVYAVWEAVEYELSFYYATAETDLTVPVAERKYTDTPIVMNIKTGDKINLDLDEASMAIVKAATPEGYRFLTFRTLDGSLVNRMPAGDLALYATYSKNTIDIYVDYNNGRLGEDGKPLPLEETMKVSPYCSTEKNRVYYGDDIELLVKDEETGAATEMGTGVLIKRTYIADGNRPGENYEVVGWNVYHVDAGANVYDKNNWKPGINDTEGSTLAYTTVIYQPIWKHHTDFFVRFYGSDNKIYSAFGKDFKMYYWENNYVISREEKIGANKDPENYYFFGYLPEIENFDWDRFFEPEMWSNVTLRYNALVILKSVFTIESFIALMGALGNLIKGLL